jgi:hypothetical protein
VVLTPLEGRLVPSVDVLVNTYTTGPQDLGVVAMDAAGDFVVAWQSYGQDGSNNGIYAQRYAANGTAQGSEFRVNTHTTGSQDTPAVAMDAAGDFVVTWTDDTQEGLGLRGIYAQRYAANGTAQGSEFRVNSYTTNNQFFPAVAMDAKGDFTVAWSGEGPGDSLGVFMDQGTLLPPAFVPDWVASASSSIGGAASGVGGNEPSMSDGLVRYADGVVTLSQTDLWSDGYGIGWGQARSWTNGTGYATQNTNGNGMINTQQPSLVTDIASRLLRPRGRGVDRALLRPGSAGV